MAKGRCGGDRTCRRRRGRQGVAADPLVKLGEWDEYYVFDETKAVVAFKEVRNAYSGMSYEELLAEQARMDKQVIPPPPERSANKWTD